MARKRGTGNLQQEKNGTWTLRVGAVSRDFHRGAAKATPASFPPGACD